MRNQITLFIGLLVLVLSGCTQRKDYQESILENTIEAYNQFLVDYPEGKYAADISLRLAGKNGYADGYRKFLLDFPKSELVPMASAKLDSLTTLTGICSEIAESAPENPSTVYDSIDLFIEAFQLDDLLEYINRSIIIDSSAYYDHVSYSKALKFLANDTCISELSEKYIPIAIEDNTTYTLYSMLNYPVTYILDIEEFYKEMDPFKFKYELVLNSRIQLNLFSGIITHLIGIHDVKTNQFVEAFNSFAKSDESIESLDSKIDAILPRNYSLMDLKNNIYLLQSLLGTQCRNFLSDTTYSDLDVCSRFEYWNGLQDVSRIMGFQTGLHIDTDMINLDKLRGYIEEERNEVILSQGNQVLESLSTFVD